MSNVSRLNYRTDYLRGTGVTYDSLDYKSFYDVLSVTEEVLVIDLSQHARAIPPAVLEEALPGPPGLYFTNSVEPVYSFVNVRNGQPQGLVSATQREKDPTCCDILSYDDFINTTEPVFRGDMTDKDGNLKLFCRNPLSVMKYFKPTPGDLYTGVHLLKIEVWNRLLYRDSLCLPISSLSSEELSEHTYLTKEGVEIYKDNYPIRFDSVVNRVDEFIGKDKHHLIRMRVNDCELIVEKGLDYRVVEYYRNIFEHLDGLRLDQEGY